MPIYAQSAPNEGESPAPDAHVAGAPPTDLTAAIIHYHDHIPTPIVITRAADGLILYANAAFAQLHRLPAAQLLGHFAPAWYAHPDDGQQLLQRLCHARRRCPAAAPIRHRGQAGG